MTADAKGPVPVVAEIRPEDSLWLSARRPEASCLRPVPEFVGGTGVSASSDTDNLMLNSNHGVHDHSTGIYESGGKKDVGIERTVKKHVETLSEGRATQTCRTWKV